MMATSRRRSRQQSRIDDDDDVIEGLPQSPSTERTSSTPEVNSRRNAFVNPFCSLERRNGDEQRRTVQTLPQNLSKMLKLMRGLNMQISMMMRKRKRMRRNRRLGLPLLNDKQKSGKNRNENARLE